MRKICQKKGFTLKNIFSLKIGGAAGQGVKSAGLTLAKIATRSGYHIYTYTEYPSLIRGGHNVMQINICPDEVIAPQSQTDLLIALNQETINLHSPELLIGADLIFDNEDGLDTSGVGKEINLCPVPLVKLAQESGGDKLFANTVAVGAALALLGGNLDILQKLLEEEFISKGDEVIKTNQKAAESGFGFATEHFASNIKKTLVKIDTTLPTMIVNGNEAISLGAVASGLQFAAIYPMTPITNIIHTLAPLQEKFGFAYVQPEDEIAAINMAIGASFAGAKALVATSGGGFCLMSEGLGLAGMTQTPLVIILGMRPGPATGLPTWTEQGDLQFALHAHQGDFPRIVLAAGDAKEAFDLTRKAFDLAEKYQTPVIVLVDKNICENDQSFAPFDYSVSEKGDFPKAVVGSGNFFIANSEEHDEMGFSSEEAENRNEQMIKRMAKLKACATSDMKPPELFGPEDADLTIVSWGSNKGAILQAIKEFNNVNFLYITWMSPFPVEVVTNILQRAKHIVDIESNYTGQLAEVIREKTGIEIDDKMLKFDGRPFYPTEIVGKITKVLKR